MMNRERGGLRLQSEVLSELKSSSDVFLSDGLMNNVGLNMCTIPINYLMTGALCGVHCTNMRYAEARISHKVKFYNTRSLDMFENPLEVRQAWRLCNFIKTYSALKEGFPNGIKVYKEDNKIPLFV
eukprot:1998195-Amphidinium_carterae.2